MNKSNFTHIPVLLNEVIEGLNIKSDGIYLDLTLGRAGHSSEILKRLTTGKLIGVDQDQVAIDESRDRLSKISDHFELVHSNFVNLPSILEKLGINKVDGILMDLGVSSPQFDDPDRGFSYKVDSRLDMRMDIDSSLTAHQVINNYSLEDLTKIFKEYGDEKFAYSIAKNIVKAREKKTIDTTFELVDIIKASKPSKELKKPGHPAKQVFQAIRIEVNDELNVLKKTLEFVTQILNPQGRLAIITFHSGEDKIVKAYFKSLAVVEGNRLNIPTEEKEAKFLLVNNKPIVASEEETNINHRSVSAKLRILEKK